MQSSFLNPQIGITFGGNDTPYHRILALLTACSRLLSESLVSMDYHNQMKKMIKFPRSDRIDYPWKSCCCNREV
jgi:hypothetical protein